MKPDEEALSGDYVSSTNRIHAWVSERIVNRIMLRLGENMPREELIKLPTNFLSNLKTLMLRALTKHIFIDKDGNERPQTEGQLMGSIVSFPILCIANAALCRMSLEQSSLHNRRFPVIYRITKNGPGKPAPLVVNGDDCLLKGPKKVLRQVWETVCGFAGLESSVGKTYFSDYFCTINSTIFKREGSEWTEAKYVNLGLLKGMKRMGAGMNKNFNSQVGIHQLGVICRELKRSCPTHLWLKVKKRFIYYNSIELKRYPGIPWFVPEWLGGVGLPIDIDDEVSDLDRRSASVIKQFYNDAKHTPILPKDMALWSMHKLVMKSLPTQDVVNYRQFLTPAGLEKFEDHWSKFYKYATINLLMHHPLTDLYEDGLAEDKSVHKALMHNVKVWSWARGNAHRFRPMSTEDMSHEQKRLTPAIIVREDWNQYNCLATPYGERDESL
jgi:hypothetical protein